MIAGNWLAKRVESASWTVRCTFGPGPKACAQDASSVVLDTESELHYTVKVGQTIYQQVAQDEKE